MRLPTKQEVRDLIIELSKIDYHEPTPELDNPMVKVWGDHYHRLVSLIPPLVEPLNVLEIGIGYGVLAFLVKKVFQCRVVATEHASRGYLGSPQFRDLIEKEGISITEHDLGGSMPFEGEDFDLVFYCDVMEHLSPETLKTSLQEIRRVMKRGGCLVLSTPNLVRLPNRLRFLAGKSVNPPLSPRKVGETYDHLREFTADEVGEILGREFRLLRREYGLIPFFNNRFNFLNSLLFPFFPGFGDELYVVAELERK